MRHWHKLFATAAAVALGVFSTALFGSAPARAQDADDAPIHYHQFYGQGFASDEEVENALGNLSFSITDCQNDWLKPISRSVQVSTTKSDYSDQRVVEAVLYRAVKYAWSACPLTFYFGVYTTTKPRFDVQSVDVYLGDGTHALSATHMHGDFAQYIGPSYAWEAVSDTGAEARAQAASAAQQAEAARQVLEAQAQPVLPAQPPQIDDNKQEREAIAQAHFIHGLWTAMQWFVVITLSWLLFLLRHALARWYYFYFYPHPAEPIVKAALVSGTVLDGKALAGALSEISLGSPTFRAVRLEQAEQLFHQMQAVSIAQLRRQEEQSLASAREQYERAAHTSIQEAVALAAVALERAKALYRASQEIGVRRP